MANLLLHSMSNFKPIFEEAFALRKPKKIVEIGSEYGGSTKVFLEYAKAYDAHLYIIDPFPYIDINEELKSFRGYFTHIKKLSLDALPKMENIDLFIIDGDHNYYTVINELSIIYKNNPTTWCFLHDVAWPWGYRDLYYNPELIPEKQRHEYTYDDGVDANNSLISRGGFYGAGKFAFAKQYGGDKNGVKKAIEDFLLYNDNLFYNQINAIMGLGLIVPKEDAQFSIDILKPYQNLLIDNMEKNRIELYCHLLKMQSDSQYTKFNKIRSFFN